VKIARGRSEAEAIVNTNGRCQNGSAPHLPEGVTHILQQRTIIRSSTRSSDRCALRGAREVARQ